MRSRELGQYGEDLAVRYLKRNGYRVLETNYQIRAGEIDIIAMDGETLCFIEVKTRQFLEHGSAREAVSRSKRKTIARIAAYYLMEHDWDDVQARFDVVAIQSEKGERPDIELYRDAFRDD